MVRRLLGSVAAVALAVIGLAALPIAPASSGAPPAITVDTTDDDGSLSACTAAPGDCSLRGALEGFAQDNHQDGVTIDVTVPAGVYRLLDDLRMSRANVNVHGAGIDTTSVLPDLRFPEHAFVRHLDLDPDGELEVALSDMMFGGGFHDVGGSIRSRGGSLTIRRMQFAVTQAVEGNGGAIAMEGTSQGGTLVVEDSAFIGNYAEEHGGAIWVGDEVSAVITNSTFESNTASFGGAVAVGQVDASTNATAELVHVTLAYNRAERVDGELHGGALFVGIGATASIEATIIQSGIEVDLEPERPSPVAEGDVAPNCSVEAGDLVSRGHNVVDDETCQATLPTDRPGISANVAPLHDDNGGPTHTLAIEADSAAVDAAGASCAVDTDQRGVARPQDGNADGISACDSGAYELEEGDPPPAVPAEETPVFTG